MSQGLIGGVLWGALAAGVGLVVASQVAAPPGQAGQAHPVEVAADSSARTALPVAKVAAADPALNTPAPAATPAPDQAPALPELADAPLADAPPVTTHTAEPLALPDVAEAPPVKAAEPAPAAVPKVATLQPDAALPNATAVPDATDKTALPSADTALPDPATDVATAIPAPGAKSVSAPQKPAATAAVVPLAQPPKVEVAAPVAAVAALPPIVGMPTLPAPAAAPARAVLPALAAAAPPPAPVARPATAKVATVVVTEAPAAVSPLTLADNGTGAPAPVVTSRAGFQPGLIAPAPEADRPPVTGTLPPPPPLTPEETALAAGAAALPANAADPALPEIIVLTDAVDPTAPSILRKPKPLVPTPSLTAKGVVPVTEKLPKTGITFKLVPALGADAAAEPVVTLPDDTPAIDRYARAFDNSAGKPLFSIVLIDTGDPQLDRAALAAMPFPVTFALDPTATESALAASIYRGAGQEVVMLATGLPEGATAADVEVSFGAHAAALPEAVAVLDTEAGGFQGNRLLSTLVVPVVKGQGRGLLSWDRGLNAAAQVAQREGLRNGVIFRRLDGEDEPKAQIRRYLDRAAFKAAQDGRVIVAGETRPDTVAALLEWAVEGRAATVALAPLSAALRVE